MLLELRTEYKNVKTFTQYSDIEITQFDLVINGTEWTTIVVKGDDEEGSALPKYLPIHSDAEDEITGEIIKNPKLTDEYILEQVEVLFHEEIHAELAEYVRGL